MIIRRALISDLEMICGLYKAVTRVDVGNLTPFEDEVHPNILKEEIFDKTRDLGLALVIEEDNKIIGFMKAYTSHFRALAHILTNTTIMIHPDYQGRQYGTKMINEFFRIIEDEFKHIYKLELLPHESNKGAIAFYQKNNFKIESVAMEKIKNCNDLFENEVRLVWFNKNFDNDLLNKYYQYLSGYLKNKYS